ncbi:MAG TPA: hypothetical protein VM686_15185, partial [Polyangiaceae bacterium]|nr:hypothetical protein [Polyangiaceae bacterium]
SCSHTRGMDVLANMVALLNAPAFLIWGATVSWAEVLGDVSGALCVWLVTRQHILNWPIGLAASGLRAGDGGMA